MKNILMKPLSNLKNVLTLILTHADAFYNLGVAYGYKEDGEKAIQYV